MVEYNMLRLDVLAKRLPKLKRPSRRMRTAYSVADVDEYNARQLMRCVETRAHYQSEDHPPGPGGQRHATTLQLVEQAHRMLPPIELAAYMAHDHGTQREVNILVDRIEAILEQTAESEGWRYYSTTTESPLRLLASIIVEEWIEPVRYWRFKEIDGQEHESPIISSFTHVMKCDRKTWHTTWKQYFLRFQSYPQGWYEQGKFRMES